ncbi:Imm72 family immunity protein [Herbaspirillum sp. RTI4]|uniref:Imm72 family immunity protein n=1 Tax=Herbaspirillum sp. RTI4 TaxID=3048640 RepID=UPI002AB58035|nr:Imm72 family immunity protein [Herbaspirillum sp. RTI4]MDY7578245.1 Imm72 family immunity protein [Herbaspirillum sp. RTI4]MEA9981583.1 Imm72 family immunity protein [Herbaspirillum sp. RTI4]
MMGLFDIFKSQWSAEKMTQEDRKKLFWYLQRRTSYTAWKTEADAFDAFAAIYKKQMVEEPTPEKINTMWGTDWEFLYSNVLKPQVWYEEGLAHLKCGDRSVWLVNPEGVLGRANTWAGIWFDNLLNHGAQGDKFFDGKYLPELEKSIEAWGDAASKTGGLHSFNSTRPAPECWSTWWPAKFAKLPFPTRLPEVPVPEKEVRIRTKETVPVSGIYEPQMKDGCMNYLHAGTSAPTMELTDGTYVKGAPIAVTWKLLWQDTRYLDGVIPAEEAQYFPPKKEVVERVSAPIPYRNDPELKTGKLCSRTGHWIVLGDYLHKVWFVEGDVLPQAKGRDVTWLWVNT